MASKDVNKSETGISKQNNRVRGIAKMQTTPIDENITRSGVMLYKAICPPVGYDRTNVEQFEHQLDNFIDVVLSSGAKVGNMALYTALGVDHREVPRMLAQNNARSDILKKGMDFCKMMREYYSQNGELNPVLSIFWAKNYDGLSDKTEITVSQTAEELPPEKLIETVKDLPISGEL